MTILPIQSVDSTDQLEVGREICQLAILKRAGLPVSSGWVVTPSAPKWSISDWHDFERKATLLKKEWMQIASPPELSDLLKQHKEVLFKGTVFSTLEVWSVLQEHWFNQIQSVIHRHDGLPKKFKLTAELLMPVDGSGQLVQAVFDPKHKDIRIEIKLKLTPATMKLIDDLVLKADKKLFLSHLYSFWLLKNDVQIVAIHQSTEIILPVSAVDEATKPISHIRPAKSVIKVILDLQDKVFLSHSVDGVMVGLSDLEQLAIVASAMGSQPVFCLMTDKSNPELEGTLGLLHHRLVLEKDCANFLLAVKKERYDNLNLVLPITKSVQSTVQLRKQLSLLGIDRSLGMKIWQVLAMPENLFKIDKYLELGVDGVILDLDQLYSQITGVKELERPYHLVDWNLLTELLLPVIKKLHQAKVTILISGKLALFAEVLEFLVQHGIWGVVVPKVEAEGLTEHLYWTAKKVIKKRTEPHILL